MNIKDYMELPEGTRVELIDGKFYDMAATIILHQKLVLYSAMELSGLSEDKDKKIFSIAGPLDVQFDDKNVVQPDVIIVCDEKKVTRERIIGAPDLVVEVATSESEHMDGVVKKELYNKFGVREYWIIFQEEKIVKVFRMGNISESEEYTFKDKIPVRIWNDDSYVDFEEIYGRIEYLYELKEK